LLLDGAKHLRFKGGRGGVEVVIVLCIVLAYVLSWNVGCRKCALFMEKRDAEMRLCVRGKQRARFSYCWTIFGGCLFIYGAGKHWMSLRCVMFLPLPCSAVAIYGDLGEFG
jgi:hypothetical protein